MSAPGESMVGAAMGLAERGGRAPSNSRSDEEFLGSFAVAAHGIDTFSLAWRPDHAGPLDAFRSLPRTRLSRRERGDSYWATQRIGSLKVGAFPRQGLIVVEGRLSPLLSGDPSDVSLADSALITLGAERAAARLASLLGVELECQPVVRRLDQASDAIFGDPAEGLRPWRPLAGCNSRATSKHATQCRVRLRVCRGARQERRAPCLRRWEPPQHSSAGMPHSVGAPVALQEARPTSAVGVHSRTALGDLRCAGPQARRERGLRKRSRNRPGRIAAGRTPRYRRTVASALRTAAGTLRVIARSREREAWDRDTATRRRGDLRALGINLDLTGDEAQHRGLRIGDVLAALADAWCAPTDWGQT